MTIKSMSSEYILITGGAGYIGSHTAVELCNAGFKIIIIDNLSNSTVKVINNIQKLSKSKIIFYNADVCNRIALEKIFSNHKINSVMHFAGFKSVSESSEYPLDYYLNNVGSTLALLKTMDLFNVRKIVFSSSATVYGEPKVLPISENSALQPSNTYGQTKLICEKILQDLKKSSDLWNFAILRYFNPVGAHESGLIGDRPNGIPNNIMPYITQVASGERAFLNIFGNDYQTTDGTGVRDFIHVVDLAKGHLSALNYLMNTNSSVIVNLGRGEGISVLKLVETFERVNNVKVPYFYTHRRTGDIAISYADTKYANQVLNWKANLNIEGMCKDAWAWYLKSCKT